MDFLITFWEALRGILFFIIIILIMGIGVVIGKVVFSSMDITSYRLERGEVGIVRLLSATTLIILEFALVITILSYIGPYFLKV